MTFKVARQLVVFSAMLTAIGCDRFTKHVATETIAGGPDRSFLADTVRLTYAENAGGFLGLGANLPLRLRTGVFTVATGLMLLAVGVAAVRYHWHQWSLIGLAVFVSGGASNWIDRLVRGSVVDFMNVGIGPLRTGIFNMADVMIMLGAVLIVAGELRHGRQSMAVAGTRDERRGGAARFLARWRRLPR